jgi:hypothetical protein
VILFFVCFFLRNCRIALSFPVFPLSLFLSLALYILVYIREFVRVAASGAEKRASRAPRGSFGEFGILSRT